MKKEQIDPENFNFYRDENGTVTAEPKVKSLKLDDIVYDQKLVKMYAYGQTKKTSARKAELFGQIQRIADYANGDWVEDWKDETRKKWFYSNGGLKYTYTVNYGQITFASESIAEQAYADNKDIFDEFFSL
jgi:hypothetical protein